MSILSTKRKYNDISDDIDEMYMYIKNLVEFYRVRETGDINPIINDTKHLFEKQSDCVHYISVCLAE